MYRDATDFTEGFQMYEMFNTVFTGYGPYDTHREIANRYAQKNILDLWRITI